MSVARLSSALVFLLFAGRTADACEGYYVLVFAYQSSPNKAELAHSFATFVKVTREQDTGTLCLDYHTISWLPEVLDVTIWTLRPETGYNLTLEETLANARKHPVQVSLFSPYQIREKLYERSLKQREHLNSGKVRYKAVDTGFRTSRVSNCIHAVSDTVFGQPRLRVGTPAFGIAASYRITCRLKGFIVDIDATHEWLVDALGLREWPMQRLSHRDWRLWFPVR